MPWEQRAAQVSDEQPFGVPAQPPFQALIAAARLRLDERVLLDLAVGLAERTVAHQLLLIVLAAFVAIGLDPAVASPVRSGAACRGPRSSHCSRWQQ